MWEYRFYSIKQDGHVDGPPASYKLADDGAAIARARGLTKDRDVEIWQAERLVAYVVPDHQAA